MFKTLSLLKKSKRINEAQFDLSHAAQKAAERLRDRNGHLGFTLEFFGEPYPILFKGKFYASVCDADANDADWLLILRFWALSRIGYEVARELGTNDNSLPPVASHYYPQIESELRKQFGLK